MSQLTPSLKTFTRRRIVASVPPITGAIALAACGAPQAEPSAAPQIGGRDVTLRLWHWDNFLIEPFQKHSAELTKQFPKVKVEVEHTPKAEYVNKLIAQVAGGAPPDTIGVSVTGDFNTVQSTGLVRELDSLVKRDKYDTADFHDVNLRQHKWGGKQIGLPYGWTTIVFFFNETLFKQHGVKTPYEHWKAGTWTWDTYLDLVQRFNRVGDNVYGTVSLPANNNSLSFPFVWSNNGDIFDAQYTKATIDQAPALEAWEFMHKASQLAPTGDQARISTRDAGKIAMWFDWDLWYQGNLKTMQFSYSMAPEPAAPKTKKHVFLGNAPGFSVTREGKNQEEAWALLKHMVNPEGTKRYFLEANIQPLRKSQTNSNAIWKSHSGIPNPDLMYELATERGKNGRIPPRISNFPEFQAILREEFGAAWANTQSVKDAAIKATERSTVLLKEAQIDK